MKKAKFAAYLRLFALVELSNFCYALGIQIFLVGNHIAGGGFSGIAIILSSFFPIQIGTLVLLMNIPLFIVSWLKKGRLYTLLTAAGVALYTVMVNSMGGLPTVTDNPLVAAVYGGVLYGVGAALLTLSGISGGSVDLVARLLQIRFPALSYGKLYLAVDGCVVLLAMLVYRSIETGLYAIITIYVCSVVSDRIMNGFDKASLCYIISDADPKKLAYGILHEMDRGVTLQEGIGMFRGQKHNVLITVVRPRETYQLKRIVSETDPDAFVVMAEAHEVLGNGFKGFGRSEPDDLPRMLSLRDIPAAGEPEREKKESEKA